MEELASEIKSPSKVTEGSLWQADHVVPVWRGGGLCGLENLQTLCTACHSAKTKEEAKERSTKRRTNSSAKERKEAWKLTGRLGDWGDWGVTWKGNCHEMPPIGESNKVLYV